ncbi:hypothetical protein C4569_02745 [Candidatus Parcubacteria bacterium]|nr:MAG: hypothetical protein C4569_02745 [Candidatus Parcubacteria bacterium]
MPILNTKNLAITLIKNLIILNLLASPVLAADSFYISNIRVIATDDRAIITWNTSEPTDSLVEYEEDETFDASSDVYLYESSYGASESTYHEITLYNLSDDTRYHFRVSSANDDYELYSYDQIFTTQRDLTAAEIENLSAVYVTGTTATIQWETSKPSTSVIEYGTGPSYGRSVTNSTLKTVHDLTVTNLTVGTDYYYRVRSTDADGNTTASDGYTFRTAYTNSAEISELQISELQPVSPNDPDVSDDSAVISYRTNKLADCVVYYGRTTSYGSSKQCPAPRDFYHEVNLTNLYSATKYYFRISSKDVFSRTVSQEGSFITVGWDQDQDFEPDDSDDDDSDNYDYPFFSAADLTLYSSFNSGFDADSAKGSRTAVVTSGQLTATGALSGKSASLTDNDAGLTYSSPNNVSNRQGTISFWFKPSWPGNDNKSHILLDLSTGSNTQSNNKYFTVLKDNNNYLAFVLENANDQDFQKAKYNASGISAGSWYHVAVTWNYATGRSELYFQGAKVSADSPSGNPITFNPDIYIGSASSVYSASGRNDGQAVFDEIGIYDGVLSANQIRFLADKNNISGWNSGSGSNGSSGSGSSGSGSGTVYGSSTLDYTQPTGLYKSDTSPRIYAVYANRQKHYIASPEVFESYGYSWSDIQTVSASKLASYPDANLVKLPDKTAVYFIYTRKMIRKYIPSADVFNSYPQNEWANIITISEKDLEFYPETVIVKDIDRPTVYLIENNVIYGYSSWEKFLDAGYGEGDIAIINNAHLKTFILGSPIN